jgi:hypothetical protein
MSNSNLKLWESVEKTDPKETQKAKVGGRQITAIKPQYQRKQATKAFGPIGRGWGVINESYNNEVFGEGSSQQTLCRYSATLWYIYDGERGEFPIASNVKVAYTTSKGQGYFVVDDEYAKKASTDALTKGLSALGFNADIFMGLFDDSKYVNQMIDEFTEKYTPEQESDFNGIYNLGDAYRFCLYKEAAGDVYEDLVRTLPGKKKDIKDELFKLEMEGMAAITDVVNRVTDMVNSEDPAFNEELDGLRPYEKNVLAGRFGEDIINKMNKLKEANK